VAKHVSFIFLKKSYIQVAFDSDPGNEGKNAIIAQKSNDSHSVHYILPKDSTTEDQEVKEYEFLRGNSF
jgi:hypothetical protein